MEKARIVFLVNGDAASAMGLRARAFAERLADQFEIEVVYRAGNKVLAILRFFRHLSRRRPHLCYVFDMAFSGVIAAGCYRLIEGGPMLVDTGDAIYQLSRSTGNRGPLGLALTRMLEWAAFSLSDGIIVRSHPHQELLQSRSIAADVVPDAVDTEQFRPADDEPLRKKYQLDGHTVIGLLGSLVWSPRWQMCYGWELVEVIHQLKGRAVKGLIIGDGTGLERLKARCAELGIEDRVVFLGRAPYQDLPRLVSMMDICLSTQTNDIPGRVRTTGKLPIYLACGRFVLASQVGEAALVLPAEMLVPYEGTKDVEYPRRLAERIEELLEHPEVLRQYDARRRIAQKHFEYRTLAPKVRQAIEKLLSKPSGAEAEFRLRRPPQEPGAGPPPAPLSRCE
ncbi:MAG TPA: glycosyltransferase [Bryobacteraceae bacterium]|nr:glycosyltransferase [Bryobacteraceae bacterium]